MRQQTKPFIVERKPSRKPGPDTVKQSIWGNLQADIARGLENPGDEDQPVAAPHDGR